MPKFSFHFTFNFVFYNSWLHPRIVDAFKVIHEYTKSSSKDGMTATLFENGKHPVGNCQVRFYSIEVWDEETGNLAAGELGCAVGNIYTR